MALYDKSTIVTQVPSVVWHLWHKSTFWWSTRCDTCKYCDIMTQVNIWIFAPKMADSSFEFWRENSNIFSLKINVRFTDFDLLRWTND